MKLIIASCWVILFNFSIQEFIDNYKLNEYSFNEVSLGIEGLRLVKPLKRFRDTNNAFDVADFKLCKDWELDSKQLYGILTEMEEVESHELYSLCYKLPCWYRGCAMSDSAEYEILISSTSYIILNNEKEDRFFVLKEDSDLFLFPCNCCE